MNKRLLNIIASAALAGALAATSAFAAPAAYLGSDSVLDTVVIPANDGTFESATESNVTVPESKAVLISDSAEETNTLFKVPDVSYDGFLSSELGGKGTAEEPYIIANVSDFQLFANNVNSGIGADAHYKLTANIDLGGMEWTPIGHYPGNDDYTKVFSGVFDGCGYTVSNFTITKDTTYYIGLFGYIYGGTIKNLIVDKASINVVSATNQNVYAGVIVGRVISNREYDRCFIENCNVTSSSLSVKNNGSVYAGGIAGSVITGNLTGAYAAVAFCSAECNVSALSDADQMKVNSSTSASESHLVAAGGITGYLSSQKGSSISVINCYASGDISVDTTAISTVGTAYSFAGGVIGNVIMNDRYGTAAISGCSSEGTVTAKSKGATYGGGFAGQLVISNNTYIKDCYSKSDVYGESTLCEIYDVEPFLGGFVGLSQLPGYTTAMGKKVSNCYTAGDVTATGSYSKYVNFNGIAYTSYVGEFVGYSFQGIFQNCYKLDIQTADGATVFYDPENKCLTGDEATASESYAGFDFGKNWEMGSGEYVYPVLKAKTGYATFYANDAVVAVADFGSDGKISAPDVVPTKASTAAHTFSFSHWSASENDANFDFVNTSLTQNTSLHAVFTQADRKYKLNFMNGSTAFVPEQTLVYGSKVIAPAAKPTKPETNQYYYEFLHWSAIYGGEAFDFSSATLLSDLTLYAVFDEVDKTEWKGGIAESFASGYGTETLPYVISNCDEFALFAKVINEGTEEYKNAYYELSDNINLGKNYWLPIGSKEIPFSAHFDGNGYSVSNFKLSAVQYSGLFGYVLNGTIKNVNVAGFEADYTIDLKNCDIFVGGVAGYVLSTNKGVSEISGVRVSYNKFNVVADITEGEFYAYIGSIVGRASAEKGGNTTISDSFALGNITLTSDASYGYVGGIAGRLDTGSASLTSIHRCYYVGSISSTTYHSTHAGGLVGHIFSYGSAYASTSGELSADIDVMVFDSFAIADVYGNSTKYYTNVGRLIGSKNSIADVSNIFYAGGMGSVSPAEKDSKIGVATAVANLRSQSNLETTLGFDFDDVWTFTSDYEYPELKRIVGHKPILDIVNVSEDASGALNAQILVKAESENYSVIVGVYNARNQMISIKRFVLTSSDSLSDLTASFENVSAANYISVSAYDNATLAPLLDSVTAKV